MTHSILLHLSGEPTVIGEVEELPKPTDVSIMVHNPRQKDGKELHYLDHEVVQVIWPMHRVSLIEVLESEGEDRIIGFVRE
jgi:hypothetical protein